MLKRLLGNRGGGVRQIAMRACGLHVNGCAFDCGTVKCVGVSGGRMKRGVVDCGGLLR